jgi:hypothetical protein
MSGNVCGICLETVIGEESSVQIRKCWLVSRQKKGDKRKGKIEIGGKFVSQAGKVEVPGFLACVSDRQIQRQASGFVNIQLVTEKTSSKQGGMLKFGKIAHRQTCA